MSEASALGRFEVRAEASEVAAFRSAIGLPPQGKALPLTFPMRWLAAAEVRAAITAMIPEADLVPFHEAQTFDYDRPLLEGTSYTMALTGRRLPAPDRLVLAATFVAGGQEHGRCETTLRLFALDAAAS